MGRSRITEWTYIHYISIEILSSLDGKKMKFPFVEGADLAVLMWLALDFLSRDYVLLFLALLLLLDPIHSDAKWSASLFMCIAI